MTINIEIVLLIQYIRKPSNPNNRLEKFYVCPDAIFHRSSHPIDGIPVNTTMLSQRWTDSKGKHSTVIQEHNSHPKTIKHGDTIVHRVAQIIYNKNAMVI